MTDQSEKTGTDFENIFHTHWSGVYAVIYRIVGNHAEADDLTLETFLRLHQRPPGNPDNISGWLYRVATNKGLNALRSQKRRGVYENEAGKMILDRSSPPNPAVIFERQEERQRVRQALSKMKKRSAKILILRYSGFSYAEVAASVGVRPNSVGTLLARAEREFERHYRE